MLVLCVSQARAQGRSAHPGAGVSPRPSPIPSVLPASAEQDADAYPRWTLGGRVITGWARTREAPQPAQEMGEDTVDKGFVLDQARFKASVRLNPQLRAALSFDLDAVRMRNAYLNLKLHSAFQLKLGRFKRPFSRLENASIGKLPIRGRGLFNDALIEDANWGDRALGLMLWGKHKRPRLRWYLGIMHPVPLQSPSQGIDVLARVTYKPVKAFGVGLNGGYKYIKPLVGDRQHLSAVGVDAEVKASGLRLLLEGNLAQNPNPPPVMAAQREPNPFALGVLALASYELPLSESVALQPAIFAEWLDTDLDFSQDEAARLVLGVNLLAWDGMLRLMPQVELVRPLGEVGPRSRVASETVALMVTGEL